MPLMLPVVYPDPFILCFTVPGERKHRENDRTTVGQCGPRLVHAIGAMPANILTQGHRANESARSLTCPVEAMEYSMDGTRLPLPDTDVPSEGQDPVITYSLVLQ
jgi:hypothetical protein